MTIPSITRSSLQHLTWKPFDDGMWDGFAGCQSPVPFYAEDESFLYILDGYDLVVYHGEEGVEVAQYDVREFDVETC